MSMWANIVFKLKEMIKNMIGSRTVESALNVTPVISSVMEEAIQLWSDMYKNQAPWVKEPSIGDPVRVTSLGLPSLIASEKARMALLEFQSEITTPIKVVQIENPKYSEPKKDDLGNTLPVVQPEFIEEEKPIGNTDRAEYLQIQYEKLKKLLRRQVEYGIAKGGLVIKPYVVLNTEDNTQTTIEFDFIQADSFYPLAFNSSGQITEAAFIQTKSEKNVIYRRLEYHKWENNKVQIINKAFKSTNNITNSDTSGVDLGQEIPLKSVPEWKDLQPSVVIQNIDKPLFAYFKMPEANTVDTTSPLGVSGYSRAVNLIKDADMQYSRLLWEYEAGEMAINIDRDAFKFMEDGKGNYHTVLGKMQERLYRQVDIDTATELFEPYSPSLRDNAYIEGLNTILMRIEDVCGISRGTLSDAAAEARTATELKILKQRSYQTNADIQEALQDTLEDVVYIMNVYCTLYEITKEGEYEVSFEWDDSIIVDVDEELNKRITLMQNGLTSKLENRMWYFGETEIQAAEALRKIEEENLQNVENSILLQ